MKKTIQLKVSIEYDYPDLETNTDNDKILIDFVNRKLPTIDWQKFIPAISERTSDNASAQFNIVISDGEKPVGHKRFKHSIAKISAFDLLAKVKY